MPDTIDEATQRLLDRGERLTELLKQGNFEPLDIKKQIISIASGVGGLLDRVSLNNLSAFQERLYSFFFKTKLYSAYSNVIKVNDPRKIVGFLNFNVDNL